MIDRLPALVAAFSDAAPATSVAAIVRAPEPARDLSPAVAVGPEQLSALEDLVRGFLLSKSSATTRTAYATDLASWLHWCNRLDLDPLQAGIHHADAYWCAPSSVESRCCTSCHGD